MGSKTYYYISEKTGHTVSAYKTQSTYKKRLKVGNAFETRSSALKSKEEKTIKEMFNEPYSKPVTVVKEKTYKIELTSDEIYDIIGAIYERQIELSRNRLISPGLETAIRKMQDVEIDGGLPF